METVRNDVLTENLEKQRYDIADLVLQYKFLQDLEDKGDCDALTTVFKGSLKDLNKQSQRLQFFEQQRKISQGDFQNLRLAYTVSQINYWLLARDLRKTCSLQYVDVLYFFDEPKACGGCENQGIYLDYVKKVLGDEILIFALDVRSPGITQTLITTYGVEKFPAVVINDQLYYGLTSNEIFDVLCINTSLQNCPKSYAVS